MSFEICVTDIDDTRSTVAAAVVVVAFVWAIDLGFSSIFLFSAALPLSLFLLGAIYFCTKPLNNMSQSSTTGML